jgi:hypothetical protein
MQGVTDGHILVIGHGSQKIIIRTSKNEEKEHLSQTSDIGDDSAVNLYVHNHLWDSGREETDVSQR